MHIRVDNIVDGVVLDIGHRSWNLLGNSLEAEMVDRVTLVPAHTREAIRNFSFPCALLSSRGDKKASTVYWLFVVGCALVFHHFVALRIWRKPILALYHKND